MCGITGMVFFDKERRIDNSIIKKMSDSLYNRGPDDGGEFVCDNVGLGFRRLSIIDLCNGHQPMTNFDKTVCIVFNGEIYNYAEQRNLLIKKGHSFKTSSDTEVILHLYEEFGEDCVSYLRGMFAFTIWDSNKKQLFCARDRFGIKPFYYYTDVNKFVFGSEIKAIRQCPDIVNTISVEALESYFAFGYITSNLSIYDNIKKLPPAHYLKVTIDEKVKIEITRYWEIDFEPDYSKSEKQWIEEIEESFSEVVRLHMISDVPLGAFLSGGIDSSSVVAMMAKNSKLPIKTFSIGFHEQEFNELKYAKEVALRYGCQHHEQIIEPESINLLPKLVKAYDEPFADASAIPTYYVSKLARQHVAVALSGDGGDELFAGYSSYSKFQKIKSFPLNFKNANLNKAVWGKFHDLIPQSTKGKGLLYFLSQNKPHSYAFQTTWTAEERSRLFKSSLLNSLKNTAEQFKVDILNQNPKNDFISNLQYLDMMTYMVDDVLTKVDRASMMNSLEVRVPILDHKFAELSFKIPWNLKLNRNEKKYILKKSMQKHLPENILSHKKQGFGVPLAYWFKKDLKEYVNDTLLSANPHFDDYLNKNYVRSIVEKDRKGGRDFNYKIWSLIFFEEWLKQN